MINMISYDKYGKPLQDEYEQKVKLLEQQNLSKREFNKQKKILHEQKLEKCYKILKEYYKTQEKKKGEK